MTAPPAPAPAPVPAETGSNAGTQPTTPSARTTPTGHTTVTNATTTPPGPGPAPAPAPAPPPKPNNLEVARAAALRGDSQGVRRALESQVRSGHGTPEEANLVYQACREMKDKACSEDVKTKYPNR